MHINQILMSFSLLVGFMLGFQHGSYGQRFGYIQSDSIIIKMPEYKAAQEEVNRLAMEWKDSLSLQKQDIELKHQRIQMEKPILSEEEYQTKYAEIAQLQKEWKESYEAIFGYEGRFFKTKNSLIIPIRIRIEEASQRVCQKNKLHFILDKASNLLMVYYDASFDYTAQVMRELGIVTDTGKSGKNQKEKR